MGRGLGWSPTKGDPNNDVQRKTQHTKHITNSVFFTSSCISWILLAATWNKLEYEIDIYKQPSFLFVLRTAQRLTTYPKPLQSRRTNFIYIWLFIIVLTAGFFKIRKRIHCRGWNYRNWTFLGCWSIGRWIKGYTRIGIVKGTREVRVWSGRNRKSTIDEWWNECTDGEVWVWI